jgi:hypothetical protein
VCQRLYIASRAKMSTVSRSKASPFLSVQVAPASSAMPDRFSGDRKYLYIAGGHVECGCGFSAVLANGEPDAPSDPADSQSMKALADHLREACQRHATVELYLCWAHEQSEPTLTRRTVTLADLRSAPFRLRHRELLTVGRAP